MRNNCLNAHRRYDSSDEDFFLEYDALPANHHIARKQQKILNRPNYNNHQRIKYAKFDDEVR